MNSQRHVWGVCPSTREWGSRDQLITGLGSNGLELCLPGESEFLLLVVTVQKQWLALS